MSESKKTCGPTSLSLIRVHRKRLIVSSAWMSHMVRTPSDRTLRLNVNHIEDQRSMHGNRRMQTPRRLPCSISDTANEIPVRASRLQRKSSSITSHSDSLIRQSPHSYLHSLQGRVDIAGGPAGARFLTQHVPGFNRLPELQFHTFVAHAPVNGKTKFSVGSEPVTVKCISGLLQIPDNLFKILLHKVRQQEQIMKTGAPSDRSFLIRLAPEPGHERAHEQLLRKTHPCMWRHLESTHLDQTESSRRTVRLIELVDTELRAMRVACHIHEQVSKDSIHQPGRAFSQPRAVGP